MQGFNPLIGPNDDAVGPRFPSLATAYDPELRAGLHATADELGTPLHDGVYLAVSGPSFETPAEIRAFKTMGADLVGMSTVPEAIVAAPLRAAGRGGQRRHQPRRGHGRRRALARADAARRAKARRRASSRPLLERLGRALAFFAQELIRRKRDGGALSEEELRWLVQGITDGTVTDGQAAAFAMAVFFRDLEPRRARDAHDRDARLRHAC